MKTRTEKFKAKRKELKEPTIISGLLLEDVIPMYNGRKQEKEEKIDLIFKNLDEAINEFYGFFKEFIEEQKEK